MTGVIDIRTVGGMTAQDLLNDLFNAGVAVSILATVLALGMTFQVAQLLAPLRRVGVILALVVVNAALIPAIAWGVAEALPIKSAYVGGLTLATLGAGSAAGLKASMLSKRADLPLAISAVVVLQLVNIVAVPLWAGAVVAGATISAGDIVKDLLLLVLLPLVIGLVVRARYVDGAQRWQPELTKIANLALVIAIVAGISVNWSTIKSLFGSWALVGALVIVIIALVLGALIGLRHPATQTTTALVSGMRFGSLGLIIIGTQLHGDANYLGPAIVFALIDLIIPLFVAVELGRRAPAQTAMTP